MAWHGTRAGQFASNCRIERVLTRFSSSLSEQPIYRQFRPSPPPPRRSEQDAPATGEHWIPMYRCALSFFAVPPASFSARVIRVPTTNARGRAKTVKSLSSGTGRPDLPRRQCVCANVCIHDEDADGVDVRREMLIESRFSR